MKLLKYITLFTALLCSLPIAAEEPSTEDAYSRNPFSENTFAPAAQETMAQEVVTADPGGDGLGGGDDAPGMPIDDYLPALAVAGVAIAVYGAVRSRKLKQA